MIAAPPWGLMSRCGFTPGSATAPSPAPCRLLVSVADKDDAGNTARWLHHNAVECQRVSEEYTK